jgi:hypothetical protein
MLALAFMQSEQSKLFMLGENLCFDGCVKQRSVLARFSHIVCPQVAVGLLGGEEMRDDDQNTLSQSHDRFLLPSTTSKTM